MSATFGATKKCIITLNRLRFPKFSMVTLVHLVNIGTTANPVMEKHKTEIPRCQYIHVEHILRTINEFYDICNNSCLNLSSGLSKFTKF